MRHPFRISRAADPGPDAPSAGPQEEVRAEDQRAAEAAAAEAAETARRAGLRRRAEEEGYAEGLTRGREEALSAIRAAIGPAVERIEALEADLRAAREAAEEAMAEAAITLGQTLAETLIGARRPFDRDALLQRILGEARAEAAHGALPLICRAAPETLAQIGPALPANVQTRADTEMKPGGFVVELQEVEGGTVLDRWDASVERMERCIRALTPDG